MYSFKLVPSVFLFTLILSAISFAQENPAGRPVVDLFTETENFSSAQRKLLAEQGKRYTAAAKAEIDSDRIKLAKTYAAEVASRKELADKDIYYLGRLYGTSGDEKKTLETMQRFLSKFGPETQGDMLQSARSHVIVLASRLKQMAVAEEAYASWLKGSPMIPSQQPALQDHLSSAYLRDGQYEQAITHAQNAFDLVKTFPAKSLQEKKDREKIYMNLVEVLAIGYKKNKNSERALEVLAEARARSFTLPSADLYRKVMNFVGGSGFSEKKLMQKLESFSKSDPAPEMKMVDWIGQEPASLEQLRGKVVLLDFWATWCGPCISTFPRLRGWHKKYAGDDFMIVGVTQYYGEQGGKKMSVLQETDFLREFREKYKLPYGFAIADPAEASSKYGINVYPTTILLDRNGVVRYIGIGSDREESENLEEMIVKVLKENTTAQAAR